MFQVYFFYVKKQRKNALVFILCLMGTMHGSSLSSNGQNDESVRFGNLHYIGVLAREVQRVSLTVADLSVRARLLEQLGTIKTKYRESCVPGQSAEPALTVAHEALQELYQQSHSTVLAERLRAIRQREEEIWLKSNDAVRICSRVYPGSKRVSV